jgi:hypothetical protein
MSIDMPGVTQKRNGPSRWWLSPGGELIKCDDHEFMGRQILRNQPDFQYAGIKATYDQMFSRGWVRVVRDPRRISFDAPATLTPGQWTRLSDLAAEYGVPLYDAIKRRAIDDSHPSKPRA